jgi:hypothetical protein
LDHEIAADAVMPWHITPAAIRSAARRLIRFAERQNALNLGHHRKGAA